MRVRASRSMGLSSPHRPWIAGAKALSVTPWDSTGTLDTGASETFEFVSAAVPTLRSVNSSLAGNDPLALDCDYRMASGTVGLEVLTPVPEPAPAALLLAGLATLAWRLRQRCGRDGA